MAAELKEAFGVEAKLTYGATGQFDVNIDGRTVFSLQKEGRFPNPGEVVQKLKE